MNNDKAIEFETTIYKVNKALERSKNIGLNVEKYEKLVADIIAECNEKTSYNTNTVFKNAFIENAYISAISKLESVYFELDKYEIYLKVASFNKVLKEFILSKEKKISELEQFRERLLLLLDKLKESDTLDYQVEGPLVEDIYYLTYEFIKEEIKTLEISPTLRKLQTDEVHTYNLDKQIGKELEKLDLKDPKYALIVTQKNKIDSQGINAVYLEENFISTIVKSTASKKELQEKVQFLSIQANTYYARAKDLEEKINKNREVTAKQKELVPIYLKRIYGNLALFATSVGIIGGLITGSFKLGKKCATTKTYNVTVTSYSSIEGELPVKQEISSEIKNSIQLKEYQPYEEEQEDRYYKYVRTVSTYDLSKIEELDLEEYLNVNLALLGINCTNEFEYENSLSISDLYTEAYSIVEKRITDEVPEKEYSKGWHIFFFGLFLLMSFFIDLLIELIIGLIIMDKDKDKDKPIGFIITLDRLRSNFKKLMKLKQKISEKENDLKGLYEEATQLFIENKEIMSQVEKLLPYLENNASFNKEVEDIQKDIARTLKIEDKTLNMQM